MPGEHDGHRARLRMATANDPDMLSFSDFQTLEYVLSFVIPRKDTNQIAHSLINEFGSIKGVFLASREALFAVPNMTRNAAAFIESFYPIMRKVEISAVTKPRPTISNVQQAVALLRPYFVGRVGERAYVVALDLNDKLVQVALISEGLSDYTTLDTNRIFSIITRTQAKKIIIAHNHPSGNAYPSRADVLATQQLFPMAHSINTVLADHIIFTDTDEYYSFYTEGLLDSFFIKSCELSGAYTKQEMYSLKAQGVYMYEPRKTELDK